MRAGLLVVLVGLALGPSSAWAQGYKCGNTFSDKPCGSNAVRISDRTTLIAPKVVAPPGSAALPEYVTICLNAIRARFNFPDNEALRIDGHSKEWANFEYAERPMAGQKITLAINVVDRRGSYTGARKYSCYMSEDARRVLDVAGP